MIRNNSNENNKTFDQIPQPGDVIYAHRMWGIYQHYGVYIDGDGKLKDQVIHFSGKERTLLFPKQI